MVFQKISDKELYKKCVMYGKQALQARRKFIGLLPEVHKRRLYERKGFSSVFEFAAKLAGVSHEQVNRVLQLDRKYQDKPLLHSALTKGEISVNKLARIASIATSDNERELAGKAAVLSSRALEVFVQDIKLEVSRSVEGQKNDGCKLGGIVKQNGLFDATSGDKDVHVHGPGDNKYGDFEQVARLKNEPHLHLAPDVESELLEMQQKGIDVNAFLREALKKRKAEIENEKEKLAAVQKEEREERAEIGMPAGRYIPVKIRKILLKEHGNVCSKPSCNRPAEHLHHENRFSKFRLHDPNLLKPLCKAHHELEHAAEKDFQMNRRGWMS